MELNKIKSAYLEGIMQLWRDLLATRHFFC